MSFKRQEKYQDNHITRSESIVNNIALKSCLSFLISALLFTLAGVLLIFNPDIINKIVQLFTEIANTFKSLFNKVKLEVEKYVAIQKTR